MDDRKSTSVESVLIDIAKNGDVDRLTSLLHRHCDCPSFNINAKELFTGNTALMWAAKRGHGAIIQLLLKYNCDVTLLNNDMQSALDVSPNAIRKILIENGLRTSPFSYQLLYQACWQGSGVTVRRLLTNAPKPIKVSITNIEGFTALQLATRDLLLFERLSSQTKISHDPMTTILELLTYGYKVSDIGKVASMKTPLHFACSSSAKISEKVIKLLLDSGASVSLCDMYNFTPLHCAAFNGNCPAITLLIKRNAEVNAQASKGSTPLHLSAMAGMENAVDLLLKFNADPSIKDKDQETPIDTAKTRRIKYILEGKSRENSGGSNRPTMNAPNRPLSLAAVKPKPVSRNKSCTSLLEIQNNLEMQKSCPNEPLVNAMKHVSVTSSIPVGKHGRVELHFVRNFRETSNLELAHSVNGGARISRPISSTRYQWKSSPNVSIFSPITSINKGFLPSISSSTPRITSSSSLSTERSQSGNFRIRKRNLSSQLSIQDDAVFVEINGDNPHQGRTSSKTYIEDIEDMDSGIVRLGSGSDVQLVNEDLNTIHEANEENASIRGSTFEMSPEKKIGLNSNLLPPKEVNKDPTTKESQYFTIPVEITDTSTNNGGMAQIESKTRTEPDSKVPAFTLKTNSRGIRRSKVTNDDSKMAHTSSQRQPPVKILSKTVNNNNIKTKPMVSNEKNKITVITELDKINDKPEDVPSDTEISESTYTVTQSNTTDQKPKPAMTNKIPSTGKKKPKLNELKKNSASTNKTNSSTRVKSNKNLNNNSTAAPKTKLSNSKAQPNQTKIPEVNIKQSTVLPNNEPPQNALLAPITKRSSIPNSRSDDALTNEKDDVRDAVPHRLSIPNSFVPSKNNSSSTSPMMHSPPPIASGCLQSTAVISGIGWHVSAEMNHNKPPNLKQFSFARTFKASAYEDEEEEEEEVLSEIDSVNYDDDFEDMEEDDNKELKLGKSSPTLAELSNRSKEDEEQLSKEGVNPVCECELKDDINLTYILSSPKADDSISLSESNEFDLNSFRSTISIDSNHGFTGSIIPNWRRGKLLGTGAFGKVWCILTEHGEQLAVKEIHYDSTHEAKCEAQNIQEEIEILKTVKHRNIVRFYGTSSDVGTVYIYMEYVPGGSLANALMQFGAFEESVFRRYTKQLVEGVSFLHANNVMHRDIKGANIMLMPSGIIKLIDFGCAKRLQKHLSISNTGSKQKSLIGSPYWMAPEVIMETGHGRKSDIWSIGCTVFEMATGKPPWGDMAKMAAIFAIGSGDTEQPCISDDKFSAPACEFVKSCMTRDVASRPTASDLLQHPFLCTSRSSLSRTREWTMLKDTR